MSEWAKYRIGIPKRGSSSSDDGHLLDNVFHVVHLPIARRILEDGHLRCGLIYDESRLRKSRICVTWLSANIWAPGSIYGNVQFAFPWRKQIRKRRCYWVEVMPYKNPAYRILLTDRDLSESKHVREYDPSSDKGPLREHKGQWYWNGRYTSEFMVESDIGLEDCTGFDFISHHSSICRPNGTGCPDFDTTAEKVGGRVIAFLIGNGLHSIDALLKQPSAFDPDRALSYAVDKGVEGIWRALGRKKDRFGGAIGAESSRKAVLRGALALYGHGKTAAAKELVALLNSQGTFERALTEIVNEHFGIKRWTLPE